MYRPSHFEQHDTESLRALMREHPLATLVSLQADGPTAETWSPGSRAPMNHHAPSPGR